MASNSSAVTMVLAAAAVLLAGGAARPAPDARREEAKSCTRTVQKTRTDMRTITSPTCGGHAAKLTAGETRVVEWLVDRIQNLGDDDAPVIDFTEREVAAATGVDIGTLDQQKVRDEVVSRLRKAGSFTPPAPAALGPRTSAVQVDTDHPMSPTAKSHPTEAHDGKTCPGSGVSSGRGTGSGSSSTRSIPGPGSVDRPR